ncbi:hypothetical protein SLEP1_g8684 [Rubroshorea leprosula]|uniref:CASP-like protein n=1 Tax=Rubroshorea leprosula TaxID=152421 RepID=A0AAV5ICB7_9ROSI|nr:hypothetical protein SLEP1_g8684 [Rubroshorea leprosula]
MEQVKESAKEERDVILIACRAMAGVSPVAVNSQAQHPFPTPSPFSFSVASTRSRWNTRPSIHLSILCLSFLGLLFSFVSALSLAAASPGKKGENSSSFTKYPELLYCFIVALLAFSYSAFQLFKGICDIAHRGMLISDKVSDYLSFILDQVVGYLLVSSSSIAITVVRRLEITPALWKGTIISTSMSFATFLVMATCALLSGYKLCKRIIW